MQSIIRKSPDDPAWQPWLFLAAAVLGLAVIVSVSAVLTTSCGGGSGSAASPSPTDTVATPTEEPSEAPQETATRTSTATATETNEPSPSREATSTPTDDGPVATSQPGGGPDYVDDSTEVGCSIGAPLDMNHRVSRDCVIGPLVSVEGFSLNADAAAAYEAMRDAAAEDGITLYIVSAYRTFESQWDLYWAEVAAFGPDQNTSAKPGHSEHQLGTTVDLNDLSESFGDTPAGRWLEQNAGRFGFRLSYPPGNAAGYAYEPWHWRWWG